MHTLKNIRKIFVRQREQYDCGIACLQIILNYTGNKADFSQFNLPPAVGGNGFSLLELRDMANNIGLKARCVSLDLDWIRHHSTPVILHMANSSGLNHFEICFGPSQSKGLYIMADPARRPYAISETELFARWHKKSALYIEGLPEHQVVPKNSSWKALLRMHLFPKALWVVFPMLNIFIVCLGIAITWVLQRGMESSLADQKQSFIKAIILLLFIITISRGIMTYIRQRILIKLNKAANDQLIAPFLIKTTSASVNFTERLIKSVMADIQKIQNAVAIFVSVLLSDGCLIVLLLSVILYTSPAIGCIDLLYLALINIIAFKHLPELSFSYAHLNELNGSREAFIGTIGNNISEAQSDKLDHSREKHDIYQAYAKNLAVKVSKQNLFYEVMGAVNVILAFFYGMTLLQRRIIPYGSFMILVILSYLITTLMPKIISALYVVAEGAEAARQYQTFI